MSIRIRKVNGITIALCAVESDPKENDVYLDDAQHYALATKFAHDWEGQMSFGGDPVLIELMEQEKVRDATEVSDAWNQEIEKKSIERGYSIYVDKQSALEEFKKYGSK